MPQKTDSPQRSSCKETHSNVHPHSHCPSAEHPVLRGSFRRNLTRVRAVGLDVPHPFARAHSRRTQTLRSDAILFLRKALTNKTFHRI